MIERHRILIRPEQAADYRTVENLTREAFWNVNVPGCDEHFLVHRLRDHEDFIPELDFVAVIGEKLVGNIMYSKAKIVDADGCEHPVLTFGPVSVLPEHQKQGIGSALIAHSRRAALALGYESILIYGDPEYYCRFGFRPAEAFCISNAEGRFHPALQALELKAGTLAGIRGRFCESPVYHLYADEAATFDLDFPPKEKFVTESQRTFARLAGLPAPE
jgi:predicted N-acetyltransferase YhbS